MIERNLTEERIYSENEIKMIDKVKTEGIFISEGDVQGAAEFVAMRNGQRKNQGQEDYLHISEEGLAALKKEKGTKEKATQEEQIKERIVELKKELTEIKSQQTDSENTKTVFEGRANAIIQQIFMLSMQLIQLQKTNRKYYGGTYYE